MKLVMSLLLLAIACTAGCRSRVASGIEMAPVVVRPYALLLVNNQYKAPLHVYVANAGEKARHLGLVDSYSRRVFELKAGDAVSASLQLVALSLVDGFAEKSELVPIAAGARFEFDVGPARGVEFLYPTRSAE